MNENKQKVVISLKKATSLLQRIEKMLKEDRYCIDVIQQILAVNGILRGANEKLLEGHLNSCFKGAMKAKDTKRQKEMIEELIKVMKTAQKK